MKKRLVTALIVSAFSASAFAQSAQSGWYLGASVGQSRVDVSNDLLPIVGATSTSLSKDETDTAYKVFAGYRFNRYVAVEGGWVDLGEVKATRTMTAPAPGGTFSGKIESYGVMLDAVGTFPLGQNFNVFGKAGAFFSTTKTRLATSGNVVLGASVDASEKETEVNLKLGLGGQYDFTKSLGVRLEWERFFDVGKKSTTGEGDVELISIGLQYRF